VLVIIDLCHTGDVTDEIPATLQRDLPEDWFALFTAPAGTNARLGAFSGVLKSLISDIWAGPSSEGYNDVEPYLNSSVFIAELGKRLREQYHQKLTVMKDPYEASVCLPNPRYKAAELATVATSPARRDLALLQTALDTHWLHRAPVTSERGSVFTGRRHLMSRPIAFADGPPGTLIVAGRAGSGKSAVLARLVTCSDRSFRKQYSEVLALAEPVPPPDSIDVAVLATGKTPDQIVRQIAEALGASVPAGPGLDGWINTIRPALWRPDRPVTIVIDGLDEASDPAAVALTLLDRLNPPEQPMMRMIIGVRSAGSAAAADHGGRELADLITRALHAQRLHADADEFWEQEDLADYPGVRDLVLEDVRSSIADPARCDKALRLLRAAGLSFGRGIPWRDLWAAAATALDQARPVTRDDVDWLLGHRISGYLIRDLEDDAAGTWRVMRPRRGSSRTSWRPASFRTLIMCG
jgi:hypothetical protein